MPVVCRQARPDGRSHHAGLDFFALLFALRQKSGKKNLAKSLYNESLESFLRQDDKWKMLIV